VLHRDLKPQNVILGDFGEVMVLDWGLAKLLKGQAEELPVCLDAVAEGTETQHGQVLGTPAYMSPEQAAGRLDLLSSRSDVYSLGAVLYEVLAGEPPFAGPDLTRFLHQVAHDAPVPPRQKVPRTPPALEAVCLKALAKQPLARFAGSQELAEQVQRWLADEPLDCYRDSVATQLARSLRRHQGKLLLALTVLFVVLLLIPPVAFAVVRFLLAG
jgi:serine/threonine protein kinase